MANYLMCLTHEQVPIILSATYFDALSKQTWLKMVLRDIESLIAARKKLGLTQLEVAQRWGKPQSYVAKIEGKDRKLDVMEFVALY